MRFWEKIVFLGTTLLVGVVAFFYAQRINVGCDESTVRVDNGRAQSMKENDLIADVVNVSEDVHDSNNKIADSTRLNSETSVMDLNSETFVVAATSNSETLVMTVSNVASPSMVTEMTIVVPAGNFASIGNPVARSRSRNAADSVIGNRWIYAIVISMFLCPFLFM